MKQISVRFKKIRKTLALSQEQLAMELGVSKQAISNIENEKSMPSINILRKLLVDYNVNLNYILAGVGEAFVDGEKTAISLKDSIIHEVEKYLECRGIV